MKNLRIAIGVLLIIVAINAFGGGIYALSGAKDIPLQWLEGSPFHSYFLPGIFLIVIIGIGSVVTAISLFRNARKAKVLAIIMGVILQLWILAQMLIIGYVSPLQPAVLLIGITVLVMSLKLKSTIR